MRELWRDIDEFPGFIINTRGDVMNEWTHRMISVRTNQQGFLMVSLVKERIQYTRSVAILVAKAWLDDPPNEAYNSIIHLNGDREDCHIHNLMWRPRWFAMLYHKMFEHDPYRLGVYVVDTDEEFQTMREACVKYGLIEAHVYEDMINQTPTFHYGYLFKRLEENKYNYASQSQHIIEGDN